MKERNIEEKTNSGCLKKEIEQIKESGCKLELAFRSVLELGFFGFVIGRQAGELPTSKPGVGGYSGVWALP